MCVRHHTRFQNQRTAMAQGKSGELSSQITWPLISFDFGRHHLIYVHQSQVLNKKKKKKKQPAARFGHCAFVHKYEGVTCAYMWGGQVSTPDNCLWRFNLDTDSWAKVGYNANDPSLKVFSLDIHTYMAIHQI